MADITDTKVIFNGNKLYAVRFTNRYVDTGETDVVKVDISTLTGPKGVAPSAVKIREILWTIQGYTSVEIQWDHSTDDEAVLLGSGTGYADYTSLGGLMDPKTSGGTGDILFTTTGATAGNTYDITLVLELKA